MTKERLVEILNRLAAINTRIAHNQGMSSKGLYNELDRLHKEIGKAMGLELTIEDLDEAATL